MEKVDFDNFSKISLFTGFTGFISIIVSLLFHIVSKSQHTKYDIELKKIQLDIIRSSLEAKGYDITDKITANPLRWKDINHLLLEAQINKKEDKEDKEDDLFSMFGINRNEVVEKDNNIFVLTPFHQRFDKTYSFIKEVCLKSGFSCTRGDEEFRSGAVLKHLLKGILESSIIIANIEGRNANVFYELGIAHAIGKKTILLSPAQQSEKIPFDLKDQRIIFYSSLNDLQSQLLYYLTRIAVEGASEIKNTADSNSYSNKIINGKNKRK